MRRFLLVIILVCHFMPCFSQQKTLKRGMHINTNTKFKKAIYSIDAVKDSAGAVLIIEGNNITVDFNNSILKGSNKVKDPDGFEGIAIYIKNSRNVTIKNIAAKGYKIALLARNTEGLKIEHCDFSFNYRQHLNSTQEKEDLSDWMSYHHNEKDEWLRYGAAIYLRQCTNAVISSCIVQNGQNALMMMECNNALIYNNDFSFNSGIGLGMYRCSNNKVLYNRINFNVRGYSDGIYNRGQDSAGILVYEQSSNNLFYKNSVTHGGDGFFLWAGQYTMDTGKGGSNDNLLIDNDFSYAPTNGVEMTFSRNKVIHNRIYECDHGIWGGYSYESRISENQFRNNRISIAIEHGQNDTVNHNLFINDKTAVKLWARRVQPADWAYARERDTRSRNYVFVNNSFNQEDLVYDLFLTDSITDFGNIYNDCGRIFKKDTTVTNLNMQRDDDLLVELSKDVLFDTPLIKKPVNPFKGNGKWQGRINILMTEWGPYNFQYPIIWNTNPVSSSDTLRFSLLGPAGKWKIVSLKGVGELSKSSGKFPFSFQALKSKSEETDITIKALYTGAAFIDAFGNKHKAGKPVGFSFRKYFKPINFLVNFYAFDSLNNPIKTGKTQWTNRAEPFKTDTVKKLDYAWWGGIKGKNQSYSQFLTVAEGDALFKKGRYEFSVSWDDAVRIFLDNKLILDEWNPSKYAFDESPNRKVRLALDGKHHLRIEHVELGGFATLQLKINKLQ